MRRKRTWNLMTDGFMSRAFFFRPFLAIFALAILFESSGLAQEKETTLWQGTLDVQVAKLLTNFKITKSGENYSGTIYSPDQGNDAIPITKIEFKGKDVIIEADSVRAKFVGKMNKDESAISGTWSQNGHEIDLVIKKVESFNVAEHVESWKGVLDVGSAKLEMGLQIYRDREGVYTAKLDSYSQGATGIAVDFERKGDDYLVTNDSMKMRYQATLNDDKTKLSGTFKQAGAEFPLDFVKTELDYKPEFDRPQTPKAPFPYDATDVTFENKSDKITLAATLTTPKGDGPFPVAITISGSGAQDRDETIMGHKPFLVIADHLSRNGIAVLRFDDRGVGKSTGDFSVATSDDFSRDVRAAIDFLKTRPKIDASKIGLIGHSEGGMIAPMVAARSNDLAYIVLLAGTGVDGATILDSQSRAMMKASGAGTEMLDANSEILEAAFNLIRSSDSVTADAIEKACQAAVAKVSDEATRTMLESSLAGTGTTFASPWMQFFIKYDPATALAKVKCPVLAMNGEKDLQVLVDLNLDAIEGVLKKSAHKNFEIRRMPNLNHLFQETDGTGLPGEYSQIEETFSPKALQVISQWITKTVGVDPANAP